MFKMLLIIAVLLFSFAACSNETPTENPSAETEQEDETAQETDEPQGDGSIFDVINQRLQEPREETVREPRDPVEQDFDTSISGMDMVRDMKIGWNLGNTFDGPSETAWVGVRTTPQMISDIKGAGFDTLRLPVTWGNIHGGRATAANNYTIDEDFMDRVEDVLNYALDNDMYVIINAHHDSWVGSVIEEGADIYTPDAASAAEEAKKVLVAK
jgi:endoglucanase